MKYYIIYLCNGQVVDISSWDEGEELNRNAQFNRDLLVLSERGGLASLYGLRFDQVQVLDQVR